MKKAGGPLGGRWLGTTKSDSRRNQVRRRSKGLDHWGGRKTRIAQPLSRVAGAVLRLKKRGGTGGHLYA